MDPTSPLIPIDPEGTSTIVALKTIANRTDVAKFRVSRPIIDALLPGNELLPGQEALIQLAESDAASLKTLKLLLKCMHSTDGVLSSRYYNATVEEVWRLLTLFFQWFSRHPRVVAQHQDPIAAQQQEYEQLLYPIFVFSPDELFPRLTRWLVYYSRGLIRERNPLVAYSILEANYSNYRDMRLPNNLAWNLNDVKTFLLEEFLGLVASDSITEMELYNIKEAVNNGFQGLCIECFRGSVEYPTYYEAWKTSPLCSWQHGEVTWRYSGVRPVEVIEDYSFE
ncbi:hypothetical protein HD806DRAFT_551123 [Xylariaceae sp. AK1471]|nr:hypothetical protein HD806DRAFT_551123 [Xylariaceae sp. AK1471]